jgi:hypothetical protein
LGRPIAAPLERCAELLGVELAAVREMATTVEPYVRVDGTKTYDLKLWTVPLHESATYPPA